MALVCCGDNMTDKQYPGLFEGTKDTSEKAAKAIGDAAREAPLSYQESIRKVADAAKKTGKAIAGAAKKTGKWLSKKKIKHFF
jgi:vacuolar-type H+-ATPase subunit H